MKKRLIIGIVILLVIVGGFFFFSRGKTKTVSVEKVEIEKLEVTKSVSSSGEVKAENLLELAFEGGGKVTDLRVKKGDLVTKGTFLASAVANSDYNDIQTYRDSLDIAKRDKDIYIETYVNNKRAVGGEDEYYANLRRLDELISRAGSQLNSVSNKLSDLVITAPINGTIVDVTKEKNEIITAGMILIKLADLGNLVFEIQVDQEDFGFLQVGQPVKVVLDSYPEETFTGRVSKLPFFAESTGDFTVELSLKAADKPVLLGMKGDAEITIMTSGAKVTALPFDAVLEDDDGFFVWTDLDGMLKKERVKLGIEGDFYTEIKTDLAGKQVVVAAGEDELEAGQKIKYEKSN